MTSRRNKPFAAWLAENALWFAGIGLMLASSGIDGAYMAAWMPAGFGWLGLVLNTVSDLSGMVLTFAFGQLRRNNARTSRKYKMASVLLGAEVVAVLYSWFFSWRQLRQVMMATEGQAAVWVAPIAAGFVPLLLAFIGWAQSLLVEPQEAAQVLREPQQVTAGVTERAATKTQPALRKSSPAQLAQVEPQVEPEPVQELREFGNLREFRASWDGMNGEAEDLARRLAQADNKAQAFGEWAQDNGIAAPEAASTRRHWAKAFMEWRNA